MIIFFTLLSVLLSITYLVIIRWYRYWWNKLPHFEVPDDFFPKTSISVIIPARNEATHIAQCLSSLAVLNYPTHLFEIILVDDHSTDDTISVAKTIPIENLNLISLDEEQGGKKAALACGITQAKGKLIVTTDADCCAPTDWLNYITACYEQTGAKFITGPVVFEKEKGWLEKFQSLDFMGMMLITGAGISGGFMHSSNGANLAYPKKIFEELGGFEDIKHISSGDDILFMQKVIQKYPGEAVFIKNPGASVRTKAMPGLNSFLHQRIRWGTKSTQYHEWKITAILSVVFFFCWNIILSAVLIPFYGLPMLLIFGLQLSIKSLADYYFLRLASRFFGKEDLMRSFWPSQFLHIGYIAVVGLLANVIKEYEWKGRRTK